MDRSERNADWIAAEILQPAGAEVRNLRTKVIARAMRSDYVGVIVCKDAVARKSIAL